MFTQEDTTAFELKKTSSMGRSADRYANDECQRKGEVYYAEQSSSHSSRTGLIKNSLKKLGNLFKVGKGDSDASRESEGHFQQRQQPSELKSSSSLRINKTPFTGIRVGEEDNNNDQSYGPGELIAYPSTDLSVSPAAVNHGFRRQIVGSKSTVREGLAFSSPSSSPLGSSAPVTNGSKLAEASSFSDLLKLKGPFPPGPHQRVYGVGSNANDAASNNVSFPQPPPTYITHQSVPLSKVPSSPVLNGSTNGSTSSGNVSHSRPLSNGRKFRSQLYVNVSASPAHPPVSNPTVSTPTQVNGNAPSSSGSVLYPSAFSGHSPGDASSPCGSYLLQQYPKVVGIKQQAGGGALINASSLGAHAGGCGVASVRSIVSSLNDTSASGGGVNVPGGYNTPTYFVGSSADRESGLASTLGAVPNLSTSAGVSGGSCRNLPSLVPSSTFSPNYTYNLSPTASASSFNPTETAAAISPANSFGVANSLSAANGPMASNGGASTGSPVNNLRSSSFHVNSSAPSLTHLAASSQSGQIAHVPTSLSSVSLQNSAVVASSSSCTASVASPGSSPTCRQFRPRSPSSQQATNLSNSSQTQLQLAQIQSQFQGQVMINGPQLSISSQQSLSRRDSPSQASQLGKLCDAASNEYPAVMQRVPSVNSPNSQNPAVSPVSPSNPSKSSSSPSSPLPGSLSMPTMVSQGLLTQNASVHTYLANVQAAECSGTYVASSSAPQSHMPPSQLLRQQSSVASHNSVMSNSNGYGAQGRVVQGLDRSFSVVNTKLPDISMHKGSHMAGQSTGMGSNGGSASVLKKQDVSWAAELGSNNNASVQPGKVLPPSHAIASAAINMASHQTVPSGTAAGASPAQSVPAMFSQKHHHSTSDLRAINPGMAARGGTTGLSNGGTPAVPTPVPFVGPMGVPSPFAESSVACSAPASSVNYFAGLEPQNSVGGPGFTRIPGVSGAVAGMDGTDGGLPQVASGGVGASQASQLLAVNPALPSQLKRPSWRLEDFHLVKRLYKSQVSAVYKGICKVSGMSVALKVYFLSRVPSNVLHMILREIEIHAPLVHKNIIMLYAAFMNQKHIVLVQEYAGRGDLFGIHRQMQGRIPESQVSELVLRPFLDALSYLHARGLCHRDIKPENILFSSTWELKLADFGVSINLRSERAVTRTGTLDYMAPEVQRCPLKRNASDNKDNVNLMYSSSVDIWSVGVLAYELLIGFPPFVSARNSDGGPGEQAGEKMWMPSFPSSLSETAKSFIRAALAANSEDRPSSFELQQHPWIAKGRDGGAGAQVQGGPAQQSRMSYHHPQQQQ